MQRRSRRLAVAVFSAAAVASACADAAPAAPGQCSIETNPPAASVTAGTDIVLSATAGCERGPAPPLRWTSTAPTVVTVDSLTGVASAVGPGVAEVVVTAVGVIASARIPVTVTCTGPGAAISVQPTSLTLVIGGVVQASATVVLNACAAKPAQTGVTWSSADPAVATVDSDGLIRGIGVGATVVTASALVDRNLVARIPVAVGTHGEVLSFSVTPARATLGILDTVRLRPSLTFAAGLPAGTSRAVTYRSLDSCAVAVDSTGLVTAYGSGGATPSTTVVFAAVAAYPTVTQTVTIDLPAAPRGPSVSLQLLAADGTPVDAAAAQGTITAVVNLRRAPFVGSGRAELSLAGRVVGSAPIARASPGEQVTPLRVSVNTAQRDALGTRVFANGAQQLELRVTSDGVAAPPACSVLPAGQTILTALALTLANP